MDFKDPSLQAFTSSNSRSALRKREADPLIGAAQSCGLRDISVTALKDRGETSRESIKVFPMRIMKEERKMMGGEEEGKKVVEIAYLCALGGHRLES